MRVHAQEGEKKPEVRIDAVDARYGLELQAGGGVQIPAGYYARIGVVAAAGAVVSNGGHVGTGRLDVIGRFLLDPFRQQRWGLSVGAGMSFRVVGRGGIRPYLATVVDLEGPLSEGGISPAFQLGIGGGIRVGGALRWGAKGAR